MKQVMQPLDDERWEQVKCRTRDADGRFVYAVLTTGVYCRPSCAARLPQMRNVRFFESNAQAERAGFRPCKRCQPDAAPLAGRHAAAIAQACRLLQVAEDKPDYAAIARAAGLSRHHFHRLFKDITGMTPGAYLRAQREALAVKALGSGASVTQAIYEAGYSSSSRFYETLGPVLGLKPGAYRRKGAGETIRFAVGECSLGSILVAATAKGVCSIQFGDDPQALAGALQSIFPQAELIGGDHAFERLVAEVVGFVENPACGLELPLDVRGTVFQHKVWQALRAIPPGATATYAQVAATIGAPKAARAVASACAGNKLAVAIPCHRVVRTGGALAGYRWGVARKAALLLKERGTGG